MEIAACSETQLRPKVSFAQLFQWPESDAEFLRKLIIHNKKMEENPNACYSASELCFCHEGFLMRQKFLRSYSFSREETISETTYKEQEKAKTKSKSGKGLRSFSKFFKTRVFKSGISSNPEDDGRRREDEKEDVSATKRNAVHPYNLDQTFSPEFLEEK